MKRILAVILCAICCVTAFSQENYKPTPENVEARERFADKRFGIFIHWGLYSMMGQGEWVMNNRDINYQEYPCLASNFYPSRFNADEWVDAIASSGAKYITVTSRHHDGFSMFGTKASDYNVVDATPFGRDVIGELAAACASKDLALHFYYSHLDWGRTDFWPRGRTGNGTGRPDGDAGSWRHYLDFMNTQLTELLTNYGPVGAIWFDGVWDKDAASRERQPELWNLYEQYELIHRLQPSCLVGNNHHLLPFGGEDIQIFERDIPGRNEAGLSGQEISALPLETCQTMNGSWGYNITDTGYKSAEYLIRYLVQTAGKGANLLLNIGPRPDGTLPDEAVDRLHAIGEWMKVYGETIYGTEGGCVEEQSWGVTTQKGKKLYVHVLKDRPSIYLPLSGVKLVMAKSFDSGDAVSWRQTDDGIVLDIPVCVEEKADRIFVLDFDREPVKNVTEVGGYTAFLYSNMSLADLEAKPVEYWEANVREALEARKTAGWDIPEREFRHFVLPTRVNNEYQDDFRTEYGRQLRSRIKGLPADKAALEINHWCHEMATYKPSDARTSSPLQTIQRGLGRCGEESVLGVAALRAAGIPARQVYTPRWAHTDDNHAWVEVYVDGKWWFLGACEPEPRLNMGWFNGPVSRAMLLHTKVFGNYEGPEDVIDRRGAYTEINVTSGYVPTRRTLVTVVDENGSRVRGASVEFKIYNYAEFYTVAEYQTGTDGTVSLHTGKGDLLIWASKGDRYGVAKASDGQTTVVLDHRFGRRASFDFEIVPPVEDPIPTGATEEEIAANKLRLAEEDEIRSARPHGNDEVIDSFLAAQKNSRNARSLVASLSDKDRGDVTREVLDDAAAHTGARFKPLRDCPRIEIETLVPYFGEIGEGLKKEGLKFRNKAEIREWVDASIRVDEESNPQMLRIPPVQVWRTRRADPLSKDIFYVALCRVAGFEAEYDAVNGKVQEAASETPVAFEYDGPDWLQDPLYYRHFTLAKIEDGAPRLLNLDDNADIPLSSIGTMKLESGEYLLTTGVRMADGSVQAHLELFEAISDAGVSVPLKLGSAAGKPAVIGSMDAEQLFLRKGESKEQSLLSATGRGYFIIAVLGERDEPSIHAVNELASCAALLNDWGRPLVVLSAAGSIKGLESVDNVIYGTDPEGKVLKMLADGCNAVSKNLPVVAVCDSFGRIVLFRQGYDTSLSATLTSLLPAI